METCVTRFDAELIRHTVLRELNRNGQIFVHNQVNDIENLATKLRQMCPSPLAMTMPRCPSSARTGHARFVNHRFDILLSTTIVESGLDIPNANTIFIDGPTAGPGRPAPASRPCRTLQTPGLLLPAGRPQQAPPPMRPGGCRQLGVQRVGAACPGHTTWKFGASNILEPSRAGILPWSGTSCTANCWNMRFASWRLPPRL